MHLIPRVTWYPPQSRRFVIIIGYSYRVRSIPFDDIVWILYHRVIQQHLYQYHYCVVFITSLNGMKIQLKKYITTYVRTRKRMKYLHTFVVVLVV